MYRFYHRFISVVKMNTHPFEERLKVKLYQYLQGEVTSEVIMSYIAVAVDIGVDFTKLLASDYDTVLHLLVAAGDKNIDILRLLLTVYADVFLPLLTSTNIYGNTPLHLAAICTTCSREVINLFIETPDGKASTRIKNRRNKAPLELARSINSNELVPDRCIYNNILLLETASYSDGSCTKAARA